MNRATFREVFGGKTLVCVNDVAEGLQVDRGTARAILAGLPHLRIGSRKLYSTEDVADRLMERRQT
jgi:hypothetical protein